MTRRKNVQPLTGPDLYALRRVARIPARELAKHSDLAFDTIKNTERVIRLSVGRESAMKYLLGLARIAAERQQKPKPLKPIPADVLAEIREQGRDRLREEERRRQLSPDEKRRKRALEVDAELIALFVSECCETGDPNSVMAIPLSTFEVRLSMFIEDENLTRNAAQRDKLSAVLREYIGSHFRVTKAGVHGLRAVFDRKPPAGMYEPYAPHDQHQEPDQEPERQRSRPGLERGRWGEATISLPAGFRNDPWFRNGR